MKDVQISWCSRHEAPMKVEREWQGPPSLNNGNIPVYQTLTPCGCTVEWVG